MSTDLQWLLVRKHNAHIVKRVPEGPVFSKEPGNLRNLHSYKYSGLSNEKTIEVRETESGVQLLARKKSATSNHVKSGRATTTIRARSGGRRSLGVAAQFAKRSYRPDLRKDTLARVSALLATHKEKRPAPPKKTRGKKKVEVEVEA